MYTILKERILKILNKMPKIAHRLHVFGEIPLINICFESAIFNNQLKQYFSWPRTPQTQPNYLVRRSLSDIKQKLLSTYFRLLFVASFAGLLLYISLSVYPEKFQNSVRYATLFPFFSQASEKAVGRCVLYTVYDKHVHDNWREDN